MNKETLAEKIETVVPITTEITKIFPNLVCVDCISVYDVKEKIQNAQSRVKKEAVLDKIDRDILDKIFLEEFGKELILKDDTGSAFK